MQIFAKAMEMLNLVRNFYMYRENPCDVLRKTFFVLLCAILAHFAKVSRSAPVSCCYLTGCNVVLAISLGRVSRFSLRFQ